MSGPLWRLVADGKMDMLRPAYDVLSDIEEPLALTVSLFERGPGLAALEALFDSAPDAGAFLRAAGIEAAALDHVHLAPLPDEDWVAMSLKGLKPVTAGRFFVHGSHDAPQGDTPILIEANQAFGTGHHGTTRGCLLAFDALLGAGIRFTNVLDLGCGAGTLAIAAAKTTAAAVTASDNDPLAIEVTRENLAVNGVSAVGAIVAEGLDHPELVRRAPYDLVFANILAGPLVVLAPSIARSLQTGGRVILSGLLAEQRNMVASAYEAEGLGIEAEAVLDGWSTLVMRRP